MTNLPNNITNCYVLNKNGTILGEATPVAANLQPVSITKETFQKLLEFREKILETEYQVIENTRNNPICQTYAEVTVDGKVVATIDNQGGVKSSNIIGSKISSHLLGSINGKNGPVLAQARAEQIAEMLDGTIKKASTAQTQFQFEATPKPTIKIDTAAMKQDPAYQALQEAKANYNALYLVQELAQKESENI